MTMDNAMDPSNPVLTLTTLQKFNLDYLLALQNNKHLVEKINLLKTFLKENKKYAEDESIITCKKALIEEIRKAAPELLDILLNTYEKNG